MYYKNRHNKHVDYHKSETNKYGTRQVLQIDMLYFINTVFCIVHSKLQKYRKAWNIKFTMFGDSSFQRMNKKKSFFLWISKCHNLQFIGYFSPLCFVHHFKVIHMQSANNCFFLSSHCWLIWRVYIFC